MDGIWHFYRNIATLFKFSHFGAQVYIVSYTLWTTEHIWSLMYIINTDINDQHTMGETIIKKLVKP